MKIEACFKLAILFFLFLLPFAAKAQLDLIHYVPPLYAGTYSNSDIGEHKVVFTTPSTEPIDITIKNGDGSFSQVVTGVSVTNPASFVLGSGTTVAPPRGVINHFRLNKIVSDQGFIFTSTKAFYVNIRHESDIHGLYLTAKGQAALGTSFRSGHLYSIRGKVTDKGWGQGSGWQYRWGQNQKYVYSGYTGVLDHRSHFISVMATEDNTLVTFSDIKIANLTSDTKTAMPVTGPISVTLNAGDSYVLGADLKYLVEDEANSLNGTKVISDKPIAVNSGSWCGGYSLNSWQDIGADQIVPEKLVGKEYILLKGKGNEETEIPIVVATKDNTEIRVNGSSSVIKTLLKAGDSYAIPTSFFSNDDVMLIKTSESAYLYQTTSASDRVSSGIEYAYATVGMNFIPPLSALGFRQVDIPFVTDMGDDPTGVVIIYAQKGSDVYVNGSSTPLGSPIPVTGNDEWVVYKYLVNKGESDNVSVKSSKAIYVALSVEDNAIGAAGYFSGFTKSISPIDTTIVFNHDLGYVCSSQEGNIELAINSTPTPDWYEWYHDVMILDSIKFKNENLLIPVPDEATKYILKAYFRDPNMDILYNGDFAIGRGSFDSDMDFFNTSQLADPGKATLTSNPESIYAGFENFTDLDGVGKMLLAHSSGNGLSDTIWQQTINSSTDIPNNLFVLKVYGRLAHEVDVDYSEQFLDIFVNNEKIYSNFQLNDTGAWQSVKAFWRAGTAEIAKISIVDANATGIDAVFALDSISFVPALESTKEFNPDVVPSYSYTPYDKGAHLCKGAVQGVVNIAFGDMEWFTFLWEKKMPDNTFAPITDTSIEDLNTFELKFNNVVDNHEGIYRCTIGFKETYEQCGIGAEPTSVLVEVFVDEPASIDPLEGKIELCEGTPTDVTATIFGDFSVIKWSVFRDGETTAFETNDNSLSVFNFNSNKDYIAGNYIVRCEVINGCSTDLFEDIGIKILGKAKLEDLIIPTNLCETKEITLEATLEADYTPANSTLEYSWYKNGSGPMGTTPVGLRNITPDIDDISYKVQVNTHYNFGLPTQFTCIAEPIEENLVNNPIDPEIKVIGLNPVTVCEGTPYIYKVELETPSSSYTYSWDVSEDAKVGKLPADFTSNSFSLASVSLTMAGDYTVTVSNNCDTKRAINKLTVNPKLLVTGVTALPVGPYCSDVDVTFIINDNGHASSYTAKNLRTNETRYSVTNIFTIKADASTEGEWLVTALNSCGNKETSFTINLVKSFILKPIVSIEACVGGNVSLKAIVETPPAGLTYQWKDELGADIAGKNSSVLEFNPVELADAGEYTCVVSDGVCATEQETGTLSVDDVTTANLTPESLDICEGLTHHFEVSFVGNPTFAWFFTGADNIKTNLNIPTSSYDTPLLDMADGGLYSCEISTGCGIKVFKQTLNILTNVTVSKDPSVKLDICEGEHTTLILNVTGSYASIKWYKNGTELTGKLNKKIITTEDLGTPGTFEYKYIVDGSCGPVEGTFDVNVHDKPVLSTLDNNMEECAGLVEIKITESGEHNGISWWKNDVEITDGNAESTDFVINPAASPADDGTYIARVSSDHCGDNQVSISLDIRNQIVVTDKSNPITTVCENETVSLFVIADGDDIIYKWYKKTDPTTVLSDQPTLDLGNVVLTDAGTYKVDLSNDLGCGNTTEAFDVVVNKNPKIVTNPVDKIVCETEASVDFTIEGDVQGIIHYQWYDKNDVAVGTDNPTLTVVPVDGQSYYCVISGDACGTATSEKATLTIIPKVAVSNPEDLTINDGADASFKVTASGEKEYSYQWEIWVGSGVDDYNPVTGAKYSGITTAELKITNALKADFDGNQYRCVVTSDGAICTLNATATSSEAILTINSINKIVSAGQPENQAVCEGEDITFSITGTKTTGLTYQWQYHEGDNNFKNAKLDTDVEVSTHTISGATQDMENWGFRCLVSDGLSTPQLSNEVMVDVWENIVVPTSDYSGLTACVNAPFSITVEATGDILKYKWYKVGDESITLSDKATFSISKVDLSHQGTYKVDVYNDQSCNNETRTFGVDVLELLTLDDPEDAVMCIGDPNPTYTVTANGDGPFTYQWYDKDHNPVGTNDAILTVGTAVDGQSYYCKVFNNCNTIISKSALLKVIEPLAVTDPYDQIIADGGTATFTVEATGEPNYSYQWRENTGLGWSDIINGGKYSGAKSDKFVITGADQLTFDGNIYQCVVETDGAKGCVSVVTSGTALLTINPVDKILIQPVDDEVCINLNAKLSVEGNVGGLTYVWKYDKGSGFVTIVAQEGMSISASGNVSTLTIPATDLDINNWKFICDVDAGFSPEKSREVMVKVIDEVSITMPVNPDTPIEVCKGESRNLSVTATGDDKKYKWYVQGAPATIMSTTDSYFVDEINADIVYVCEVSNDCVTESRTFTFTVRDVLDIATQPVLKTICEGEPIPEFIIAATGYAPLSYQWFENGVAVTALVVDGNKYTPIIAVDGNTYYCVITDGCGNSLTSDIAELVVNQGVTITSEPANIAISDGENATFELTAIGDEIPGTPITYQWQILNGAAWDNVTNDVHYSGSNEAILTITKANFSFNGKQYRCLVSNTCSTDVESATATLTVNALFKIFTQPTNLQACIGDDIEFEITGTSEGLTYEWEYSTNGVGFNSIGSEPSLSSTSDLNGSKLKVTLVRDEMKGWSFHCIVIDYLSEDDTSNAVSMEVFEPIQITPIDNQELCFNESKQLTLNVISGTEPYTYSWTKDAVEVSTTAIVNIGGADNGNYEVTASNGGGCPDKSTDFTVIHHSKLGLNAWANADHVCIGTPEILSVSVDNFDPELTLSYKWYKDGGEIVGETNADYNLAAADKSKIGLYKVEVYDGCSTEIVSGYVDVYEPIARVSDWKIIDVLCVGNELNLEIQVTGDVKSYTWTHNGIALVTGSNYIVASVSNVDAGTYVCVVEDNCGNIINYTTDITILDIPKITTGLDLTAVCEDEALLLGPIAYDITTNTTIDESIIWKFNDLVIPGKIDLSLDLGIADPDLSEEGNYRVEVSNVCGTDFSVGYQDIHPIPTLLPIANQIACQGENVIFRAVATGENLTYRWLVDGAPRAAFDDKSELVLSNVQPEDMITPITYAVECIVSSCGTDKTETAEVTVSPNTILKKSIKGNVVYVGSDYTFDLDVTGSNLIFEWWHTPTVGTDELLTAATTKSLTISDLSLSDAGEYYCIITGDCGVRFTSGYLTVKDPIKLVSGLGTANIEKCFGEPLNLNISVEGEVSSIKWFKDEKLLGHDELNYSIPSLDISDYGTYRCEIDGEGGSIIEEVKVIVHQTTVLKSHLTDRTLCELEDLQWIPDVSGSVLTYDWKYNGVSIPDLDPKEASLEMANLKMGQAGVYSVDISGKCGNVSSEANLSLKKLPFFISNTEDKGVCENHDEIVFSVVYGGDNLEYQWQKDDVDIEGANSSELKLQNIRVSASGEYKCVVSSSCGLADRNSIMRLGVTPQLKILSESPGMEICNGGDAQFIVEVEGNDVVYQWKKDGLDLPGEIAPQLTINPASLTEDGFYSCSMTDKCTTTERYSNSKKLIVNALPSSQISGRMTLCVLEDRVAYSTTLQPNINYGWLVDGGEFTTPSEGLRTKITWGDVIEDGKVKLMILNEVTGCYSQVDSLVTLRPLPDVKLTALETRGICQPEFELSGGFPAGGIYWVNGISQNTFDPAQGNGEYQVRYSFTDDLGCSNSTGEMVMKIDSLPLVKIIEDVLVGSCETRMLSAETEENNIKWSPSRYLDDPNSETPNFKAGETTLYVATVVDKFGCVGNDIVNVTVAPLPTITTISDTIIGECKEIELTTHISGDVDEINWTNPSDLDNAKDSNPKLIERHLGVNDYQINVTDKYGCVGSASIKVEVLPNPEVGESQFLCEGETLLVDTKDLSNPVWDDGYTAWERTIDKPGEYVLSVEQNDCELKQRIVMNPLPEFELDNTTQPGIVIFEGETLTLDPGLDPDYGPYVYDWSDGSVLPQLVVSESGTYKLSVEDNIGCIATDTIKVEVKPIGIESPNAFTPLSNNENDHFYLKDINVIDKFEMYIYNRWGELMYKTTEPGYANGWNGTYKGADCPVGAYVWVVMLDGEIKEKGTVILVR